MTILEMCFAIDRVTSNESYDKEYEYWTVDENGTFLFMNYNKNDDFLWDNDRFSTNDIDFFIHYIFENRFEDKPLFIPYEELKPFEQVSIEFECKVDFDSTAKYPLVCVRGTCDKQCGNKNIEPYCFHNLPCFKDRPDWNVYSCKYPNAFDLIFSVVDWIKECKGVDALVIMFEYEPYIYQPNLNFDYCTALLVHGNTIRVIADAKQTYKEYNKRYPTEDHRVEESISSPEDEFYFRF